MTCDLASIIYRFCANRTSLKVSMEKNINNNNYTVTVNGAQCDNSTQCLLYIAGHLQDKLDRIREIGERTK